MELRHLRYFIAVAEELNFRKAADRLHISQPPLSRQICQLEEEIGVALLVRDRRRVVLTDPGQVLLKEARTLMGQVENVLEAARRAGTGRRDMVKIGIAGGLGETVYTVLREYCRRFPALDIECTNILSSLQNSALREKRIDVGFLRPVIDSDLASEVLFNEPLLVLLRKRHRLARRKVVSIAQLAKEPLLLHERSVSSGVYDKILQLYCNAGVKPALIPTHTGPYEEAGRVLVASGKGIYIGAGAVLRHPVFGGQVTAVRLAEPEAFIEVHMAWRRDEKSPSILAFLDCVRTVLRDRRVMPLPSDAVSMKAES